MRRIDRSGIRPVLELPDQPTEIGRPTGGADMHQTTSLALPSFIEGVGSPLVMLGGGTLGAGEFTAHARALAGEFRVVRLQTLNIDRAQTKQPLPAGYSLKT